MVFAVDRGGAKNDTIMVQTHKTTNKVYYLDVFICFLMRDKMIAIKK
jgi:hypothetical protein